MKKRQAKKIVDKWTRGAGSYSWPQIMQAHKRLGLEVRKFPNKNELMDKAEEFVEKAAPVSEAYGGDPLFAADRAGELDEFLEEPIVQSESIHDVELDVHKVEFTYLPTSKVAERLLAMKLKDLRKLGSFNKIKGASRMNTKNITAALSELGEDIRFPDE